MPESDDSGFVEGTTLDRIAMVWPLTCEAYASDPNFDPNAPLNRNIARLIKMKRDS
jgi:hypothetical protein